MHTNNITQITNKLVEKHRKKMHYLYQFQIITQNNVKAPVTK